MTLEEFLRDNRAELIRRTRGKVADRHSPPADSADLEHGVPLFLSQLSATLEEQGLGGTEHSSRASQVAQPAIAASAGKHGRDLLRFGFSIEQVVDDYGDVCQAVTELAEEHHFELTVAEFHTLNRCLDNAMASAVLAWSDERDRKRGDNDGSSSSNSGVRDLGNLLNKARAMLDLIREGGHAIGGATGTRLQSALEDMRAIIAKADAT
jgi:hypothetical protein